MSAKPISMKIITAMCGLLAADFRANSRRG
jgi:hypothetical protein